MHFSALVAGVAAVLGIASGATSTMPVQQHCVSIVRTLSSGSTGADVTELQAYLGVKATGYFGPMTKSALTKWQIANRIVISSASRGAGQAGPKTRAALACSSQASIPSAQPTPQKIQQSTTTNMTVGSTSTTVIPSVTPAAPQPLQASGGGGYSTSGGNAAASQCAPFTTAQPSASTCKIGIWILVDDEAGCPVEWDCQDPNASQ